MKSVNRFILDLLSTQSQVSIPISLGDSARVWEISFSNGGERVILPEGTLAKLEIKRPTGTYIEQFCSIANNTTVVYEFGENTAVVEGVHPINVLLYDEEGRQLASPRFSMVVSERVINSDDINLTDDTLTIIDGIVAAESTRQSNETIRINNEASRVSAEESRVTAESARQTATTEAIEELDEQTEIVMAKLANGEFDGFSPTASVTEIVGGHRLTITTKDGATSIDILNGTQGEDGDIADYTVTMELDHETYILTLNLKDSNGTVVSQSTVDFPIEQLVVSGSEEEGIVTLTLVNGNTITFEIGDLVDGLVSESTLSNYYTKTEIDTILGSNLEEIDALIGG